MVMRSEYYGFSSKQTFLSSENTGHNMIEFIYISREDMSALINTTVFQDQFFHRDLTLEFILTFSPSHFLLIFLYHAERLNFFHA